QDLADRHAGVERGVGILEDDLRLAPEATQLVRIEGQQVAPVEANASRIWLDQPQHQPAHGRLAAAGLADQPQRLAALDRKANAIDRADVSGRCAEQRTAGDEMLFQALELKQSGHELSPCPGRGAARSGAPQNRDPPTRTEAVDPGSAQQHCATLMLQRARGTNSDDEAVTTPASPVEP